MVEKSQDPLAAALSLPGRVGAITAPQPKLAEAAATGPEGNARLTGTTGALLLGLLLGEVATIVALRPLISVHVFLGMLLVPPVAVKLASTGYRFVRYYTHDPAYRRKGPPRLPLRLLAPVLVVLTVMVIATGIALALVGPPAHTLVFLHKASFIAWGAVTGIHVLAYLPHIPRLVLADWRRRTRPVVPHRVARAMLLAGSLVAGAALGLALLSSVPAWRTQLQHHHDRQTTVSASARPPGR